MYNTPADFSTPSARLLVAHALGRAAAAFPSLDPLPLSTPGLDERDTRLALAIHHVAKQRWLTAEYMLDQFLRQPCRRLQSELRGVLMSGAVQLLFFDRLPAYAVVDESVNLARELVRKNARGMVNAVLRKLADAIDHHDPKTPWSPAGNRLPVDTGTLFLKDNLLPDPVEKLEKYLSVVTSHPSALVKRWLEIHDRDTVIQLCHHGTLTPPLIVALEDNSSLLTLTPQTNGKDDASANEQGQGAGEGGGEKWIAHQTPGFIVWQKDHASLMRFLAEHPGRRVQDPASAKPVSLARDLAPRIILDLCAGRGTKTRQLAQMFPQAQIFASDVDTLRTQSLHELAKSLPNVTVVSPDALPGAMRGKMADLLLLDVPCSNTAVLSRRPEARYRFRPATMDSLVALQQSIITRGLAMLAPPGAGGGGGPGGRVLYATCSLEPRENQDQVQFMIAQHGMQLVTEASQLPAGTGNIYHDGFYAALLSRG